MNKLDLIESVMQTTGLDKHIVAQTVDAVVRQLARELKAGNNVYLRGLGTFGIKVRKSKPVRNIAKKINMLMPAHKVVAFKPAGAVKSAVKKLPVV